MYVGGPNRVLPDLVPLKDQVRSMRGGALHDTPARIAAPKLRERN
jgi:hypothetical protein